MRQLFRSLRQGTDPTMKTTNQMRQSQLVKTYAEASPNRELRSSNGKTTHFCSETRWIWGMLHSQNWTPNKSSTNQWPQNTNSNELRRTLGSRFLSPQVITCRQLDWGTASRTKDKPTKSTVGIYLTWDGVSIAEGSCKHRWHFCWWQ